MKVCERRHTFGGVGVKMALGWRGDDPHAEGKPPLLDTPNPHLDLVGFWGHVDGMGWDMYALHFLSFSLSIPIDYLIYKIKGEKAPLPSAPHSYLSRDHRD